MKVNISIGIIDGESKRGIERFFVKSSFKQRKNFDEYYFDVSIVEIDFDLSDLVEMSHYIQVSMDCGEYLEVN